MEPVIEVDEPEFSAFLQGRLSGCLEPKSRELPELIRYRETRSGVRTGRWIIVAHKWEGDNFMIGWPPVCSTSDCKINRKAKMGIQVSASSLEAP